MLRLGDTIATVMWWWDLGECKGRKGVGLLLARAHPGAASECCEALIHERSIIGEPALRPKLERLRKYGCIVQNKVLG